MTVFVVPDGRGPGVLHVPEPGWRDDDDDIEPLTCCGLLMLGLWITVRRQPGDRLCPDCAYDAGLLHSLPPL